MPPGLSRRLSLIVDMSSKAALTGLKQLQSAINAVSATAGRVGTGAATGFSALQKGASAATGAMQRLGEGIRSSWMIASIAISAVSAAIGLFINKTAAAYQQMQSATIGLRTIAKSYGYSGDEAEAAARQLEKSTNGFLDMGSAAQALKNLLGAGLDLPRATEQIKAMTEQAIFNRQTHYGLAEAVIVATEGIKNEMSIAADATGTTKNLALMWRDYAKARGLNVMELTKLQKAEAAYIGFMEEGTRSAGDFSKALGTAQGFEVMLGFAVRKTSQAIGEFSAQLKWGVANALTPYITQVRTWIEAHKEAIRAKVAEWVRSITAAIAQAIETGIKYGSMLIDWIMKNRDFILEVGKAAAIIGALAVAMSYLKSPILVSIAALLVLMAQSEVLRGVLMELAKFVNDHKGVLLTMLGMFVATQIVTSITMVTGMVGKLQFALLALATSPAVPMFVTSLVQGFAAIMVAAGPWLLLVGALTAAGVALYRMWDESNKRMKEAAKTTANMKTPIENDMTALMDMSRELQKLPKEQSIKIKTMGMTETQTTVRDYMKVLEEIPRDKRIKLNITGKSEIEASVDEHIRQLERLPKEQLIKITTYGEKEATTTAGAHLQTVLGAAAATQKAMRKPEGQRTPEEREQIGLFSAKKYGFSLTDLPVARKTPTSATKATDEQMQAMKKLRNLQAEINMEAMSGYAKEVEAIRQKREASIAEQGELQKKAGVAVTLIANTTLAEKEAATARQKLDQETLSKVRETMGEIMALGMTNTQVELANIDAVKQARIKALVETRNMLRAMAEAPGAGPEAKQRLAEFERKIPQSLAGVETVAATSKVDVVKKGKEEDKQKLVDAQKAMMDEMTTAAIAAYNRGDIADALSTGKKIENMQRVANSKQELITAMMAGESALTEYLLNEWGRQSEAHQTMLDVTKNSFMAVALVMERVGQAMFDKDVRRQLTAVNVAKMAGRAVLAEFADMIKAKLELRMKEYVLEATAAAISLNFVQAAKYAALAALTGLAAGVAGGYAERQRSLIDKQLSVPTGQTQGGGSGGGEGIYGGSRAETTSFAAVSVQKEPNITIAPSVTIEAGHDVFIGEGSVEEFKVSLERVMVQSIKDAMSTGQIKVGRG